MNWLKCKLPPIIFTGLGIPRSCLKQIISSTRSTSSSADLRIEAAAQGQIELENTLNFSSFYKTVENRISKDHLKKCREKRG